jgi:hypothetical protein
MMKNVTRVVLTGILAAVLVIAAFSAAGVATVAQAQSPTPITSAAPPPTNTVEQTFWQALATRLGVTIDQLTQAVKDAARDTIASEVTNGRLTQDQATQLGQRIDQWQPGQGLPFGRGFGGPGGRGGPGHRGLGGHGMLDAAATALGMTPADLMTELQSGQTLADVAQAQGVNQDAVKQAIVDAKKAEIDAAVQAGRLTADQAAQMKQQIDQAAANLDLTQPFGGRGGFPGLKPDGSLRPFGPPPAPGQTPQAPSGATGA